MSLYEIEVVTNRGETKRMADYRGKVLLIVNTAGHCGFTPQYKGLQRLQDTYGGQGLQVLGFPSNQFAHQEPDDDATIADKCRLDFGVTFPLFKKTDVKGRHAHPLFRHLTTKARGLLGTKAIKWNFTKFLVDHNGRVVKRFAPNVTPEKMESHIQKYLSNK
jgi:glutathione peroxidase